MLAPSRLPPSYRTFNALWGAPAGYPVARWIPRRFRNSRWLARRVGPFGFQKNNSTRAFEYPWAVEAIGPSPGMQVLEIGGGLSGLQFVLSRSGCRVVNVDPDQDLFQTPLGVSSATIRFLNTCFGTAVELKPCILQTAAFPSGCFDRVVSVSVFEHIPAEEMPGLLQEVRRVLKPGGLVILTIDLFLDVRPFADVDRNAYGRNIDVSALIAESGLTRIVGNPRELMGFAEFDPGEILASRDRYLVGEYPAMTQAVVLQKPLHG